MATLCKNCGSPVVFDPAKQKVVCQTCGASWDADEIESSSKAFTEDQHAVSMDQVYGSAEKEFMDCYIYTCSSCGGEIIINGSEASTKCIYCGSSSVVFDRISKEKSPECILPFSITKEEAVDLIRKRINRSLFIPKEVKNFEPTAVRGIYVPYWVVSANHYEADVFRGSVKRGKHSVTYYFSRAGQLGIKNLPVDASLMLSDESSQRLEPFSIEKLKPFDEDYLLGFYSNVSDISNQDLQKAVNERAAEAFKAQAKKEIRANNVNCAMTRSATQIDRDVIYAMLPVWFVTFDYEGKHNTIMVNGDTGKIVGGVPWQPKKFYTLVAILGAILTALLSVLNYKSIVPAFFSGKGNNGMFGLVTIVLVTALIIFVAGLANMQKVTKQLERSQAASIFNFMKKRQG